MPPSQAREIGRNIAQEVFDEGWRDSAAYQQIPIRVKLYLKTATLPKQNPYSQVPFIQPYLLQAKITHIARYSFVILEEKA